MSVGHAKTQATSRDIKAFNEVNMRSSGIFSTLRLTMVLCLFAPALLSAQSDASAGKQAAVAQANTTQVRSSNAGGPSLQTRNRYLLKKDDSITLTFPLTPEFNQTVIVQPDGYISLTGVSSIHVEGLPVPEMVEEIKQAYSHVLHDPVVLVDLKDFQEPIFSVLGQVLKPGQYPLRYDTNLIEAVAVGGGLAPTSKTQVFLLRHTSGDQMEVHEYKINLLTSNGRVREIPRLQPGDIVFVPEKFITKFRKYVPYYLGFSASDAVFF